MALSGHFSTNLYTSSSHGTLGLYVSWTATQNIANNTSTIKWTAKSYGTMSSGYYVRCYKVIVRINGAKVLNTTSEFNMKGDGAYKKSGTITIAHNSDGNKTVAMSAQANIYWAGDGNARTGSGSFALNKIDRYALVGTVEDFNDELTQEVEGVPTVVYPKMTYTNPAGTGLVTDVYARIKWIDTSEQEQGTDWVKVPDEGGEYQFTSSTLPQSKIDAMLAACPNENQLPIQYEVKSTLNGTVYTNAKAALMTVVNANPTPAANAITYQDTDTTVVNNVTHDNQIIIQKQSTLKITTALSTPKKSASIVSYSLNINGNDYALNAENQYSHTFEKPDVAGTFLATVTTTDSRGNTATATLNITFLPWEAPTATMNIERINGFETTTVFTVDGNFSSLNGLNSMTITERHRVIGTSAWSSSTTIPDNVATNILLAMQNNWEVEITVADKFVGTVYSTTVGRGIPIAFVDTLRNSFGINGFPDEDEQLFVGGKLKMKPHDTDAGVKLPHAYSTTEQVVGYWLDGSPIYEKTIEFQSAVTINANSWNTNVYTNDEDILVLNGEAYYYDTNSAVYVYWGFMALQTNTTDRSKVNLYNSRDSSCNVNILVIRYIKPTQNNS